MAGYRQTRWRRSLNSPLKSWPDLVDHYNQQRLEGARKTRNSLVEDRKTKELGRLRKENTRHAGILKQYEELIRKLVEKDLVRQELERQGLQDPIQLDANKRDDLDSQAKKLAARHLEDARIDASRTSNYSAP